MLAQALGQTLPVPFHTQHWDLEQWRALGFTSQAEAEYWEKSCCGILCLQMAMEYLREQALPFQDILKTGLRLGAYTDRQGWRHSGLCDVASEYSCYASSQSCSINDLLRAIDQHAIPIVSIKWALQNTKTLKERLLFWKKYGGHLAVVVGYVVDQENVTHIVLHHTSKIQEQNWIARKVPVDVFLAGYTGRAILVKLKT